jgi:outer membrane immunogenic protein
MHKLRTHLLTTAAVVAFTGFAYAADMPVKAPMAAPPPPVPTWTGFYIGANLGAGFGDKWWTGNAICTTPLGVFYGCGSVGTTSMDGFLGGFQVGYNWQTGIWVFGIEGTWDWTDMHGKFPYSSLQANPSLGATGSSKIEWIATVVGRVGVTIDRALLYVGGGGAWVNEKDSVSFNFPAFASLFNLNEGSNTSFGWTFLTGVEYRIDPAWSARIQYNFYDFRSHDFALNIVNPAVQASFGGPAPLSTELRIHSITAGVNYKFWGWWGGR